MKGRFSINNYFFQFILLVVLNFSLGGVTLVVGHYLGFAPRLTEPLGAPPYFILYTNLIKAFLSIVCIHVYKRSKAMDFDSPLLKYLLLGAIIYLMYGFMNMIIQITNGGSVDLLNVFTDSSTLVFKINMVIAALFVFGWIDMEDRREVNDLNQRLEITSLRELKTKAELDALQAKVNPHFLYNSLNSIHTLIDSAPDLAKEMVMLLSRLFRSSLNTSQDVYCSIEDELRLVTTYLSIEKIRFGDRLCYEIKCPDELKNKTIPRFILQPLAENAVIHGVSKLKEKGNISIVISQQGEFVVIKMSDNGPDFPVTLRQGYGLTSVYEKVRLLGGQGATVEMTNGFNQENRKQIIIRVNENARTNRRG